MRICLTFRAAEGLNLPMAHQYALQGLIYRILGEHPAYSDFLHDRGFASDGYAFRFFVFGSLRGEYRVENKRIFFPDTVKWELRSPDAAFLQTFLTACPAGKELALEGQKLTAEEVRLMNSPVIRDGDTVFVNRMTERVTDETGHSVYYSPEDREFFDLAAANAEKKWHSMHADEPLRFSAERVPGEEYRRTVTTFKGTYVTAWSGKIRLHGDPAALAFLYDTGLGSRNSQGFGLFEPSRI